MPKKQVTAKETVVVALPARAAKPKTPRVKAAKHSKAVSSEPVVTHTEATHTEAVQANPENSREVIAQIAYGHWESRGYQHGRALEDWVRAEHEYRQRFAVARL
jgi:hypothetical protein